MAPLLYLITPADPDPEKFPRQLMAVLTGPEVAAMLVRRGEMGEDRYEDLATKLVQIGQAAGTAVLVENDAALAKRIGADGVHVTGGGTKALREAIARIKPDGIVGVGNIRSRHDAMSFGEMDVDYVLFGPLGGEPDPQAAELAQWWAETFEVPSVHSDPANMPANVAATGAEFIALSDCIWTSADPIAALAEFDQAAKAPA